MKISLQYQVQLTPQKIIEVINDTEVLVDIPYSSNNIVSNFTSGSYSITYSDFNNETIGESTLTGSFAINGYYTTKNICW